MPNKWERSFDYPMIVSPRPTCPECEGSCFCRNCNGSGVVTQVINEQYVLEIIPSMIRCEFCHGVPQSDNAGSGICSGCQGTGYL